jgi:hypothetical protein
MKSLLFLIVLLSVLSSCGSGSSNPTRSEAGNNSEKEAGRNDYISGKVTEVQPGKDGYTARLVTDEGQVYFATISRANLRENAAQYRSVVIGDTLQLKGDVWQSGAETHVTVRELAE